MITGRGGVRPGTRAKRQGLLDQRRPLQERRRLWQVSAHRWLVRVGHRVHPCAGADSMGELRTRWAASPLALTNLEIAIAVLIKGYSN